MECRPATHGSGSAQESREICQKHPGSGKKRLER